MRLLLLILLLLLIAGSMGFSYIWFSREQSLWPLADTTAPLREKVAVLESKVEALDARTNDLAAKVNALASAPAPTAPEDTKTAKISSPDLTHLQSDLAALSASVSNLQAETKREDSVIAATRAQTQATVAEMIAFIQLREAAVTGRGFTHELATMQNAAKNDVRFTEPLDRLVPYAEKGAPTLFTLREQLTAQAADAEQAIAKASAQNWWERILIELKGLVSVRSLHESGPANAFRVMESDLDRGDLASAVDGMKNLPPEAQKTLEDWHTKADVRRTVDDNLRAMSESLIAGAPAPSAQDTP